MAWTGRRRSCAGRSRRIVRRLRAAGRPVRAAARTSGDIPFDLDEPTTWAHALDGVTAAYVMEPNLQTDIDRQARIPRFVTEAVAADVRRLVLLSAADLIGRATGRTVRHVDVAPEAFVERSVANGVPPDVARLLTDLLVAVRDGRGATLSDGVERALGRPPRPFEDYVTETAAAGDWN